MGVLGSLRLVSMCMKVEDSLLCVWKEGGIQS